MFDTPVSRCLYLCFHTGGPSGKCAGCKIMEMMKYSFLLEWGGAARPRDAKFLRGTRGWLGRSVLCPSVRHALNRQQSHHQKCRPSTTFLHISDSGSMWKLRRVENSQSSLPSGPKGPSVRGWVHPTFSWSGGACAPVHGMQNSCVGPGAGWADLSSVCHALNSQQRYHQQC